MNGKTSKAKPKMADITKPKKTTLTDSGSEPLVIQSRPIIGRAISVSSSVDEEKQENVKSSPEPVSAPTLPSQSKRALIVPIRGTEKASKPTKDDTSFPTTPEGPQAASADGTPKDASKEDSISATPEPAADKPAGVPEKPVEKAAEDKSADTESADDDENADAKDEKPSPETEKAVAEAAAAAKRAQELESLIDSKQFYVPINAIAHKRSIKHSVFMTVVVFLLAVVLIDLMLDSGIILLVQKFPHTHFFTTNNN